MIKPKEIFALSVILFFLCSVIGAKGASFAQDHSASRIGRSQEILEKEKALRNKLDEEEKIFIKKIEVKSISLLNEDEIREITLPFQKKWLTKKDIQQILELIKETYKQKGYIGQPGKISYQIKKKSLIIRVEELTHLF